MPTVNEFWKVAAQVASERGGLVVGFAKDSEQPELGSALDNVLGFAAEARFRVTSLSDWADWIEQVEAFYRLKPDWGRGKRGTADANYYRVKFEAGKLETAKFGTKLNELDSPLRSTSNTGFGTSAAYSTMVASFGGSAAPLSGFQGVTFLPRLAARLIDVLVHYFAAVVAGFLFALILAIAAGGQPPAWVLHRVFQTHIAGFAAGTRFERVGRNLILEMNPFARRHVGIRAQRDGPQQGERQKATQHCRIANGGQACRMAKAARAHRRAERILHFHNPRNSVSQLLQRGKFDERGQRR